MSLASSISNIFKTSPAPVEGQPAPAPVPQPQPQVPVAPAAVNPAPADPFADLWNTDPNANTGQTPALNFNLDPAKLAEIAGKIDYASMVSPELRARIAAGGEDAVAATMESLNIVNRATYQQNALATTKLIEAAVKNTEATIEQKIKSQFKLLGLEDQVASNPALKNPAFAPLVDAAKQQLVVKYPNATPAELNQMLNRYLNSAATAFAPEMAAKASRPVTPQTVNPVDDFDWSGYLTGDSY